MLSGLVWRGWGRDVVLTGDVQRVHSEAVVAVMGEDRGECEPEQ